MGRAGLDSPLPYTACPVALRLRASGLSPWRFKTGRGPTSRDTNFHPQPFEADDACLQLSRLQAPMLEWPSWRVESYHSAFDPRVLPRTRHSPTAPDRRTSRRSVARTPGVEIAEREDAFCVEHCVESASGATAWSSNKACLARNFKPSFAAKQDDSRRANALRAESKRQDCAILLWRQISVSDGPSRWRLSGERGLA